MDDFLKILIEATLASSSKENITNQLDKIAEKYEGLKVKVKLDGDTKDIDTLFKNLESLTGKTEQSASKLGKKVGDSAKGALDSVSQDMKELHKEMAQLMQTVDKVSNKGKKITTKTGDKFTSVTAVKREDGTVETSLTKNYTKLSGLLDQIIAKTGKWTNLTQEDTQRLQNAVDKLKNSVNNGDIELGSKKMQSEYAKIENLTGEMARINQAKKIELDYEEKIQAMREAGLLTKKEIYNFERKVNALENSAKTEKGFESRQSEVGNVYNELMQKQKDIQQGIVDTENMWKQVGENNAKKISEENAEINKSYDERAKNVQKQIEEEARAKQKHQQDLEAYYERKAKEESQELERQAQEVKRIAEKKHQDEMALLEKQEKEREQIFKSMAEREKQIQAEIAKEANEANNRKAQDFMKEQERVQGNVKKLENEGDLFLERVNKLRDSGLIKESDIDKAVAGFKSLSAESTNLTHELGKAKKVLADLEKESSDLQRTTFSNANSRTQKEMDIGIKKDKIEETAQALEKMGKVPQAMIDDLRLMKEMLDFKSTKADIEVVNAEMRKLNTLQSDITKAGKDEEAQQKAIEKAMKDRVNTINMLGDKIEKVDYRAMKSLEDEGNRQRVETQVIELIQELNRLKNTNEEVTTAQQRNINIEIEAINRLITDYKELEVAKRKADKEMSSENLRKQKLGNQVDFMSDFNFNGLTGNIRQDQDFIKSSMVKQIKELHPEIRKVNEEMIKVVPSFTRAGDAIYKVQYQIERGERKFEDYTLNVDTASRSIRDLGRNMRQLKPEMTAMQQLSQAMQKVPLWGMATGFFYGSVQQAKMAFETMVELDKAMTNLRKVADETEGELRSFRMEASEMGNELGIVAREVVEATTEFARLGYTLRESKELANSALIYANVGDFDNVIDASTSMIGALKGFAIENEQVVEASRKYVDIFNEVSNNYAISSAGIGEALKRSSAQLYQAGNTVEESVAMITSANTAVQDPKKVGTALKTISMMLRGVDEEGNKVVNLVPELEKMFQSFGLSIMKDEKTFKSTFQIMDELSAKWSELSDIQQAQAIEAIGGKHQGAVVAAMIQNWKDAEGAHNTALNSMGSAQREFEKYQDGFEYKIGRLKNAWEELWLTIMDDKAFKVAIDGLTELVQAITNLIDKFGMLAPVSSFFYIALLAMNKNARDLVFSGKGLRGMVDSTQTLGTLFMGLGNKILTAGKFLTRFVGWGLALNAVVFILEKLGGVAMDNAKARRDSIKSMEDEISMIETMGSTFDSIDWDRYDKLLLKRGTQTLDNTEHKELLDIQSQIAQVMPDVVQRYDEEGNAILKSSDAIRDYINAERERQHLLNSDLAKTKIEEFDFSEIEEVSAKMQEAMSSQSQISDYTKGTSIIRKYFDNELSNLDIGSKEYMDAIDKMHAEIDLRLNDAEGFKIDNSFMLQELVHGTDYESMNAQILQTEQYLKDSQLRIVEQVNLYKEDIVKSTQELDDELALMLNAFAINNDISQNSNEFLFLQNIASSYEQGLADVKANGEDIQSYFLEFGDNLQSIFDDLEGRGLNLGSAFSYENDAEGAENFIQALRGVQDEYGNSSKEGAILAEVIDELTVKMNDFRSQVTEEPLVTDVEFDIQGYDTAVSNISTINQWLEQIKEQGHLSADAVGSLVEMYPHLANSINNETALIQGLTDARVQEEAVAMEAYRNKIMADNNYFTNVAMNNSAFWTWLGQAYKGDLSNFKDLASAKQAIEQQLISKLSEDWGRFYNAQTRAFTKSFESLAMATGRPGKAGEAARQAYKEAGIDQMIKDIEVFKNKSAEVESMFNNIVFTPKGFGDIGINPATIGLPKSGGSKGSKPKKGGAGKKGSGAKDKSTKAEEADYKDLTEAIIRNNQAKYESLVLDSEMIEKKLDRAEDQEDYNKQLELTNKLLGNEKKRQNELIEANKRLHKLANDVRKQTKFDTSKWFDANGEETIAYLAQYNSASKATQEAMQEVFDKLKKIKDQHKENRDEYEDLNDSVYELQQKMNDIKFDKAEKALDKLGEAFERTISRVERLLGRLDNAFDMVDDEDMATNIKLHQNRNKVLEKQIKTTQDAIRNYEKLKKELQGHPDLIVEVDDKIQELRDSIEELNHEMFTGSEDIKEIYKEIAEDVIEKLIEQIERERDAQMKSLDEQIKREEERHNNRVKNLEDEMSAFEKYINQQISEMDKLKDEEDWSKSLAERQKEAQKIQDKINAYSLDNTLSGKAKKEELEKELAEILEDIEEMKADREFELRKQSYQDQLDEKKEHIDNLKDEEDKYFDSQKETMDKTREEWNKHYDNLVADEERWNQVREAIMTENVENIVALLGEASKSVLDLAGEMGENISNNLNKELEKTIELLKKIASDEYKPDWSSDSDKNDYIDDLINGEGGVNDSTFMAGADFKLLGAKFMQDELRKYAKDSGQRNALSDKASTLAGEARSEGSIIDPNNDKNYQTLFNGLNDKEKLLLAKYLRERVMPTLSSPDLRSKIQEITDKVAKEVRSTLGNLWSDLNYAEALQKYSLGFDTGGYTGTWSNGSKDGRLAMLHQKELVLNQMDTKNILDVVKIVRDFKKWMPKLTPISPPVDRKPMDSSISDRHIEINFNIDKLMGGEEGAKTLMSKMTQGLKRRGVNI